MRRAPGALGIVCTVVLVGAAAATGYFLRPVDPPEMLQASQPMMSAPATTQVFDDARRVQVRLVPGPDVTLTSNFSGVVTHTSCTPGEAIESGTTPVRVDDSPIVALHMEVPPFRDLAPGTEGEDVRALQTELVRLGVPVDVDGYFGWSTAEAVNALRVRVGLSDDRSSLRFAELIWLPTSSIPVTRCEAVLGSSLAPGAPLAVARGTLQQVELDTVPASLALGERTLTIFGVTGALEDNIRITAPEFLAELAVTAEAQTVLSTDSGSTVTATTVLAEPLQALKVPAAAIFGAAGDSGCIQVGEETIPVALYGSSLGSSLVGLPEGHAAPKEVNIGQAITHSRCEQ